MMWKAAHSGACSTRIPRESDAICGMHQECATDRPAAMREGPWPRVACRLDFAGEAQNAAFVSITHLRFDARLPLAREIIAYQKHRVKRLQRQPA